MKKIFFKIGAIFFLVNLLSCKENKISNVHDFSNIPESEKFGGQLIVGLESDVANLNPLLNSSVNAHDVFSLVFAPLFVEIPQKNSVSVYEPFWVESFNYSVDSLSISFKLKDHVFWTDGKKSSAYDVKFSHELLKNSEISDYVSSKENIDSLIVKDSMNFTVFYKTRNPYQLMDLNDGYILPEHIFKNETVSQIKEFEEFNHNPVSNGPYKITDWRQNAYLKLERNSVSPFSAYIDKIIFQVTPDASIRANQLLNGEIDYLSNIPEDFFKSVLKDSSLQIRQYLYPSTEYIIFNLEKFPFNQKEFRFAVKQSINVDSVAKVALGNSAKSINTVFPEEFWAADTTAEKWQSVYEPNNSKKTIETKFKNLPEISIKVSSAQLPRQKAAFILKNQLERVGLKLKIEILEADLMAKEIRSGNYNLAIWGTREGTKPDLSKRYFKTNIGKSNLTRYSNPKFEILHQLTLNEPDSKKAYSNWVQLQKMILNDVAIIPLFQRTKTDAVSAKVLNVQANQINLMNKAWTWFIPKDLQ